MLNLRDNFNARSSLLKKARDGEISFLFRDVFFVLEQTPLDKHQQSFLDEIKKLADCLQHTVLDRIESMTEPENDPGIQEFLWKRIQREMHTEKPPQSNAQGVDQTPDPSLTKKQNREIPDRWPAENVSLSPAPITPTRAQTTLNAPGQSIPKSPVNQNSLAPPNLAHGVETSIVKLKTMVVEEGQLSKIFRRQPLFNHFIRKDINEEVIKAIEPGSVVKQKNMSAFHTLESPEIKQRQQVNQEKLLTQINADQLEKKTRPKREEVGGGKTPSDQRKNRESMGPYETRERAFKFLKNTPLELNKSWNQAGMTAKLDQKSDQISAPYPGRISSGQANSIVGQADQTIQTQKAQIYEAQIYEAQTQATQMLNMQIPGTETPHGQGAVPPQERGCNGIPEELQTAVQWMAQEEMENKLVELLSRQARLRGIDLP